MAPARVRWLDAALLLLLACVPGLRGQSTIAISPASAIVPAGGAVTLSVPALGPGFTYHWFFEGTNQVGNVITAAAGNGTTNFSGDGGSAINAGLPTPESVVVDASGNLFIADSESQRIRKVDTNGIITTVAGNGGQGFTGDGGSATNASFSFPRDAAVDASGNLFIADSQNFRIRKVDTNGIITTVAGNRNYTFSGDGGPATNASMDPQSVAVDASGNLFIADTLNGRIRRVDTNGIISTVAGNGGEIFSGDGGPATNASLEHPVSVALDASGNLFIVDYSGNRIRKVGTNGIISTVAGVGFEGPVGDGGPATNAGLAEPASVAVDASGNLFIADFLDNRIRRVGTNGIITTVAGSGFPGSVGEGGPATNGGLVLPLGVAVDASGNLFIANPPYVLKVGPPNGPGLTLGNIVLGNGGSYSVVISGSSGSVTSSVAVETVVEPSATNSFPPRLSVTLPTNSSVQLTWGAPQSFPPLAYQVQFTTDLASPNWQNLGAAIKPTNGAASVSAPASAPQSFYRLLLVQ